MFPTTDPELGSGGSNQFAVSLDGDAIVLGPEGDRKLLDQRRNARHSVGDIELCELEEPPGHFDFCSAGHSCMCGSVMPAEVTG